jgi:glycosyltransferase involved in cell wall biosynthesis
LAKYLRIPSVFIFDEYPTPIRHKLKDKIPFRKEFLYKQVLKGISGYISISEKLAEYYNNLCIKKTFILPVITDTSRFEIKSSDCKEGTNQNKYICYMGNMELAKDNVDIIIKAFAIVSREILDIELYLYGKSQQSTKEYLNQIICDLNLQSKVKFQGQVSSDLVPRILQNATLLVSSQPETLRASGGFPTKLGEYLASGVPAIFTDVGENARYAKNNVHAYFVKPNDYKEYAEKMIFVLNNYEAARIIAENGRKLILNDYSHSTMAYKMKTFLMSFNN